MRRLSSSSFLAEISGSKTPIQTSMGAADFLRRNDKMAALLPAVTRMVALQKQCAAELPSMFSACEVLQFEARQLVLSAPNAALATKLKQQLPRLQSQLQSAHWQINVIRIKVQVSQKTNKPVPAKQLHFPSKAVSAFSSLIDELEQASGNDALKNAIAAMMQRYREEKK